MYQMRTLAQETVSYREFRLAHNRLNLLSRFCARDVAKVAYITEEYEEASYEDRARMLGWLIRLLPLVVYHESLDLMSLLGSLVYMVVIKPPLLFSLAYGIAHITRAGTIGSALSLLVAIIICLVSMTLLIQALVSIMHRERLRQLDQAVVRYAQEHEQMMPTDLDALKRWPVLQRQLSRPHFAALQPALHRTSR